MRKEKTDMKAKLRRQELCIGTHVSLGEGVVSEMMGNLDYDFLWIDMEHSCINTESSDGGPRLRDKRDCAHSME